MTFASIIVQPIDHLVLTLFGLALIVGAAPYEQFKAAIEATVVFQ